MSERRAKFVGHPDGTDLEGIPVGDHGDLARTHVAYGAELPAELDGLKVPASYRDSLLDQDANWKPVNRPTGDDVKGKTEPAAADKDGEQ